MNTRDEFLRRTKERLAKRVAFRCSVPDCRASTIGPTKVPEDPEGTTSVGVAAHITAASPGGPRYDPALTPKQRQGIENGIWLCQTHARQIDVDEDAFPAGLLREWKARAEKEAGKQIGRPGAVDGSSVSTAKAMARLRLRFRRSLEPHLAGGCLIPRPETRTVLDRLEDEEARLVILHGAAGIGKSAVLFELVEELENQGIPYLPLRLDRDAPSDSPEKFAASLDLPDSPGLVLARENPEGKSVLILDQMDALRWTSSHASEAWQVFQEVVDDALTQPTRIKIVVCCRTVDLEHDPQILAWVVNQRKLARKVRVEELSEDQVSAAVARVAGTDAFSKLRSREVALLRSPLHLTLWAELSSGREPSPNFMTAANLIDRFWATRYDDLAERDVPRSRAKEIFAQVVDAMGEGVSLSIPSWPLDASQAEREALTSLHILQISDDSTLPGFVSFCHQSYLDHLVARRLIEEIRSGSADLLDWLGERDRQTLFRREQLRLVLGSLREEAQPQYLATLRQILHAGDAVRFHLRLLVLQFFSQLRDLRFGEVEIVLELLEDPEWRPHVVDSVAVGSAPWVRAFAERGIIRRWLTSDQENLVDAALRLLRSVADKVGDLVAESLEPFEGSSSEWSQRCQRVLPFHAERDSDRLFQLRARLVRRGLDDADHVKWKNLHDSDFSRFTTLLECRLEAIAHGESGDPDRDLGGRLIAWSRLGEIEPLEEIEAPELEEAWRCLVPKTALALRRGREDRMFDGTTVESFKLDLEDHMPLLRLLQGLGRELLWRESSVPLEPPDNVPALPRLHETLLLAAIREGPPTEQHATQVIEWLQEDPTRLLLRFRQKDSPWSLSGAAVALASQHCSKAAFEGLQELILDYWEPWVTDRYRRYREWHLESALGVLCLPTQAGATAHHLLPCLPAERISADARRRIQQLERKFAGVSPVSFSGLDRGHSGTVSSPLDRDDRADRLSDQAWLELMVSDRVPPRQPGHLSRRVEGGFEESSVEMFASSLRRVTERQPERFARLALQIPSEAPIEYLRRIVDGLGLDSAPDHLGSDEKEHWSPASHTSLEAVLNLPRVRADALSDEGAMACAIGRLLKNHPDHPWSPDVLELLCTIAGEHPDPSPGSRPFAEANWSRGESDWLSTTAINSARGTAGWALERILWEQPDRLEDLAPAIESLVADPHPAVRVAAIGACAPVLKIDRATAVGWFIEATGALDSLLATRRALRFLRWTVLTETDLLEPTLRRMVASGNDAVARFGAHYSTVCHVMTGSLTELYELCRAGTEPQRTGVVDGALNLLQQAKHSKRAKQLLGNYLDDHGVSGQIARIAHPRKFADDFGLRLDDPFVVAFAKSEAFAKTPSLLLMSLEEQPGDLLPYAEVILSATRTFSETFAGQNGDQGITVSHAARKIPSLLLRLYSDSRDAAPEIHQACLDEWDLLLKRRVGGVYELSEKLDES